MCTRQINDALDRLFHEEGERIVFWNDPDQEFLNTLPFLMLDGVTRLRLDRLGALEVKILLERGAPTTKFLLYAPTDLDRKMIAVVARADQPELFNLVRTIFYAWIEARSEIDLDNPPAAWGQIEKFDLDAFFAGLEGESVTELKQEFLEP
jgi:hypothetical protein